MTREEAKTIILKHQFAFASMPDDVIEAVNYLMKEPILDKIRAEIDELEVLRFSSGERIYKDEVLDIIDKYNPESEDKE